jgi:DNA/RNA endonuclease YhcR with UshA esterase domain
LVTPQNPNRKNFLIRIVVITVAVVVVMYLAKVWFVDQQGDKSTTLDLKSRQENTTLSGNLQTQNASRVILWQDAAKHYGEYATVEGKIVATHNSGKACFLNFHPNYKRYFTVVIFASAFPLFPANPESFYYGKKVRVSGYIKEYKGKPEIILNDPSQIEIVE